MNKSLPSDINSFDDIPEKSEYYYTERNENFMIFKIYKVIVFQSPFQAKLFNEYKEDIFADGTFYISPKIGYQVFITRNYVKEINSFYTTSFSILKDNKNIPKCNIPKKKFRNTTFRKKNSEIQHSEKKNSEMQHSETQFRNATFRITTFRNATFRKKIFRNAIH